MSSSSDLTLPPTTPYPIRIVSIHANPSTPVQRGSRLLTYSFKAPAGAEGPSELFGTWDSPVEGVVKRWYFKERDTVAKESRIVSVEEPCKHEIQQGGLCAICGQDMTQSDYTGFSDINRASIQMTHIANGPTVSFEEAQRIERETAAHLRKSRKLSLIVDLDQTIVHATVDPTVGEWIAEGEAWEARRRKKAATSSDKPKDDPDSDGTVSEAEASDNDDEVNPNWEALKDVKSFRLGPESFGGQPARPQGKGKEKAVENQGCLYYVKPRPGWQEFLSSVATKYEMHVYTMGTRAYAEEVCAAIDPEGKYFGGRLLSRDESGSMTQKSLERLFPVDTSMVVIIDDRADVWDWGPNLLKVIPYDFFVGIGDINSTFLPKVDASAITSLPPPGLAGDHSRKSTAILNPSSSPSITAAASPSSLSSDSTLIGAEESTVEVDGEDLVKKEMITRNSLALEAQVEERPLARLQEELQDDSEDIPEPVESSATKNHGVSTANTKPGETESLKSPKHHHRKALLKNDDSELRRLQKLLDTVHQRYFDNYEKHKSEKPSKLSINPRYAFLPYDTREIIVNLRRETLADTHIVFSGVISLGSRPQDADVWLLAEAFGAKCSTDINRQTTHLVAAKRTVKVDKAHERGGIKIVWLAWFVDSIAQWKRQDETHYLIDDLPKRSVAPVTDTASPSPVLDAHQISSDPEPDADDWDVEPGEKAGAGGEEDDESGDLEEERRSLERLDGMSFELEADAWADADREVQEAMDESDDEDEEGDDGNMSEGSRGGTRSNHTSDDDTQSVGSADGASRVGKRKRVRSMTPLDAGGLNRANGDDVLRSPLAKRKKIAADRRNSSKLKESILHEDLDERPATPLPAPALNNIGDEDMNDDEEDDDDEEDEDDDFLARELEEELG